MPVFKMVDVYTGEGQGITVHAYEARQCPQCKEMHHFFKCDEGEIGCIHCMAERREATDATHHS